MSSSYSSLLNIRPGEGRKVLMLVILFFLFITGTTWAETIIESSFYYIVGVSKLSQVFTLHALVAIISTAVYTAFVDQTSNQKLLVAVCAVASAAIGLGIVLLGVNQVLGFTILYVLVRAVRTSFLIHWWNVSMSPASLTLIGRPRDAVTRSIIDELTSVLPTATSAPHERPPPKR